MFYKPKSWVMENKKLLNKPLSWKQYILFFLIGIYGGFIQVGVGYFLLASLVLGAGYDLEKANAAKVFIVAAYMIFSFWIYVFYNSIDYVMGFTLAIGTVSGALIASHLAVKKGALFVRYLMVIIIMATSLHLFGVF